MKKKHNFNHALKFIQFITVIRWLQIQWKKNKLIVDQIKGQAWEKYFVAGSGAVWVKKDLTFSQILYLLLTDIGEKNENL